MKQQTTIKDVARRIGMSTATVSHVLNGLQCNPETREKVRRAVAELNYVPNMYARAVRSSRTKCIGLLLESQTRDNYPWILSEINSFMTAAAERGYRAMLDYTDVSLRKTPHLLNSVDGLILRGVFGESFFRMLRENGSMPVVGAYESMRECYDNLFPSFRDTFPGFRDALEHLWSLGHTRIAFVGNMTASYLLDKEKAFREVYSMYGKTVNEDLMENTAHFSGSPSGMGYAAVENLFRRCPDCTAVVFDSDCTAIGGISALGQNGLRIPDDVSVISCDDSDWAVWMSPSVTSIGPDTPVADCEVEALIGYLDTGRRPDGLISVPYSLKIRQTTGPVPIRRARSKKQKRGMRYEV